MSRALSTPIRVRVLPSACAGLGLSVLLGCGCTFVDETSPGGTSTTQAQTDDNGEATTPASVGSTLSEPTGASSTGFENSTGAPPPGTSAASTTAAASSSSGDASGCQRPAGWLYTEGNTIYDADCQPWQGRGANFHDTRSCNACSYGPPNVDEVLRRADVLIQDWGADFVRLDLEAYAAPEGRVHWQPLTDDAQYLDDILTIVDHFGETPGVYVLVSLWQDPSIEELGWPGAETRERWASLVAAIGDRPHVMFGIVNEPEHNFDGALDAEVWARMDAAVDAIRAAEAEVGSPQHLIAVQGTGGWARFLDYYVDHPIEAGGGTNIVYETHVYNPATEFGDLFVSPSGTLPVVIGEFGPGQGMTLADTAALMDIADGLGVPYLAWTFHMRCPPNLLVENSFGGCGEDMDLVPTQWGEQLRNHLLGIR